MKKITRAALLIPCISFTVACIGQAADTRDTIPKLVPSYDSLPWVYSQIFSSASPFHTAVATLVKNGAKTLPQVEMTGLWNQGQNTPLLSGHFVSDLSTNSAKFPVYVSHASDPVLTFTCLKYSPKGCDANNLTIHVPAGALPEPHRDGHIAIIDTTQNIEVDGWQCVVTSTNVNCSWGGKYPYNGTGLKTNNSVAVHAGYAAALMEITAQELLNGHIDHALAMDTHCLDNPDVYPAATSLTSDEKCPSGWPAEPAYGDLVHLKWTAAQIRASAYSNECKTVLTALATYGAYTQDTGSYGLSLLTQHQYSYTAIGQISPWATTILPDMQAAGDTDSTGMKWYNCLNRLQASDFELLQIPVGRY